MESAFEAKYNDWWKEQVILGNIPDRDATIRCRCHRDIMRDILYTSLVETLDVSTKYNNPKDKFKCIPRNKNKVDWMLESLQEIYDSTVFGEQCMIDVMYVHRIFWNVLSKKERVEVRKYIRKEPTIVKNEEVVFKWIGGWKTFSKIMCIVYQKSFDYREVH